MTQNTEKELLELRKQKEKVDKFMLRMEVAIILSFLAALLLTSAVISYVQLEEWLKVSIIIIVLIPFIVLIPYMIKIEQIAGYYHCSKCNHDYIPEYRNILWSIHMCRTRYMRCPNCGNKSWQKKVLTKSKDS